MSAQQPPRSALPIVVLALLLLGLPLAVWLDLRSISESALRLQASDINSAITSIRGFYGTQVVGRVLASTGHPQVLPNYEDVPGAIPLPATLSLELGHVIGEEQGNLRYRFVSDYPFRNRAKHDLDSFELGALAALRQNPDQRLTSVSWIGLNNQVRLISPVLMSASCVACHNTHPDSPKRDWKVGDVRGIQETIITQPVVSGIFAFRFLLLYFVLAAAVGISFIIAQRRQAAVIERANRELGRINEFLGRVSTQISRYISPQIYKSIFSGQKDVTIATERKKLTIFFSDIKDFTSTTERLQPEELTALLNEYFTEMSAIALEHGGTVDKFIGDAILVFFGDPETKGVSEDARACVAMAVAMQTRLGELNVVWRKRGVEQPFTARMGINTGFCNVGNFGSADRMDYTIIGGEANLAARLQTAAEPGQVVVSYETYALVREVVTAHELAPITVKGISRTVVPYVIDGMVGAGVRASRVISEHDAGLELYLDPSGMDAAARTRARATLAHALSALDAGA